MEHDVSENSLYTLLMVTLVRSIGAEVCQQAILSNFLATVGNLNVAQSGWSVIGQLALNRFE